MPYRDYYGEYIIQRDRITTLEQAMRDIAGSEPIPNDRKAWEFCRDVARAALAEQKDRNNG